MLSSCAPDEEGQGHLKPQISRPKQEESVHVKETWGLETLALDHDQGKTKQRDTQGYLVVDDNVRAWEPQTSMPTLKARWVCGKAKQPSP